MACAVTGCATDRQQFTNRPVVIEQMPVANALRVVGRTAESPRRSHDDVPVGLVSIEAEQGKSQPVADEPAGTAAAVAGSEFSHPTYRTGAVYSPAVPGENTLVLAAGVQPVSETADSWNVQDLQHLALQNNPAILQAVAAASRADGVHNQTGLPPNPSVGYFAEEIGNEGEAGLHGAFVSQMFVRGKKLAWNQQVVGHEVQMRRWNEKVQRQRVLTDVQLHYAAALAAQQRLELTRAFRMVAEQGVCISKQRVKAKFSGRADILQSEIQLSQIELAIWQTELQQQAVWQQLAAVVGLPDLPCRPLQGRLEPSEHITNPDDVLSQVLTDSPLLAMAQYRVSRAAASLQRQQVQQIPNLTARLGIGHDDATGDSFANLQFSVPVPAHNRNQGNIHAARAEYCEATQNVRRLKMQIRHDLAAVLRDYHSAQAAVEQYRDVIIPRAKETLTLMKQAQAGGEYDFLRVLTARRAFFDASINSVNASQRLAASDARITGLLLTGGLSDPVETPLSTGLRGQTLSQR